MALNPSSLVTNGAIVGAANGLPVIVVASPAPAGTEVTLSPRAFIVNGEIVSTTNPLPVYIAIDGDVQAWVAAVIANGGTVSDARAQIVSTFVTAEKASGCWGLVDDYWPLWGENAIQGLTSLKRRVLVTAVAAPTFTADRGYVFNGTTQYLRTGFIPGQNFASMTGANLRIAVYERTNLASSTIRGGTSDNSGRGLYVDSRSAGNLMSVQLNCPALTLASGILDSRGFVVAARSPGPVFSGYNRGLLLGTGTPASNAAVLPTREIYIGALNNIGSPTSFSPCSLGLVVTGASLSATQELAQYNAVQAWATAIGAQV